MTSVHRQPGKKATKLISALAGFILSKDYFAQEQFLNASLILGITLRILSLLLAAKSLRLLRCILCYYLVFIMPCLGGAINLYA